MQTRRKAKSTRPKAPAPTTVRIPEPQAAAPPAALPPGETARSTTVEPPSSEQRAERSTRKEPPSKLYLQEKQVKGQSCYMIDPQKVLSAPISVPLGYCLGALPERWVHHQAQKARKKQEQDMHEMIHPDICPVVATTRSRRDTKKLKEHLFIPFLVAKYSRANQGYISPPVPTTHHALVDSGAQVGVIHAPMLDTYPEFKQYFADKRATLGGVGDVRCEQVGELRKVPIFLGEQAEPGRLFYADFRVIDAPGYTVILGLDFWNSVDAVIATARRKITFSSNPRVTRGRASLRMLTKQEIRSQTCRGHALPVTAAVNTVAAVSNQPATVTSYLGPVLSELISKEVERLERTEDLLQHLPHMTLDAAADMPVINRTMADLGPAPAEGRDDDLQVTISPVDALAATASTEIESLVQMNPIKIYQNI